MGDAEPGGLAHFPAKSLAGKLVGEGFTNESDGLKEKEEEDEGEGGNAEEGDDFAEGACPSRGRHCMGWILRVVVSVQQGFIFW